MAKNVTFTDSNTGEELYPLTKFNNIIDDNGNTIPQWAMAVSKPNYSYNEIDYTINTAEVSGAVTIDGRIPLHVLTATAAISSIALSYNPPNGHSCHVIITSESNLTVAIAHDATNRICPDASDLLLEIPTNGYIEIDFLNAENNIYVRGV